AMIDDTGKKLKELRVDGGAVANDFLMQFLADILGIPILRPSMIEITGYGAATLAAVASGICKLEPTSSDQLTRFIPSMSSSKRKELKRRWKEAINRVL